MSIYSRLSNRFYSTNFYKALRDYLMRRVSQERLVFYLTELIPVWRSGSAIKRLYRKMGIGAWESQDISGERLLMRVLDVYFKFTDVDKPVIFDVGANEGNYAASIKRNFPKSSVYAFEPNPFTFKKLNKLADISKFIPINIGLGSTKATKELFTYADIKDSEHASVFKNVLTDLHKAKAVKSLQIKIDTLDNIASLKRLSHINFLKIDTEGFELEVLRGASKYLLKNKIDFIQFEFNEMNVISRVFLKDYYDLLSNYKFYRISADGLIILGDYNVHNEIFSFQNIFAVRSDINDNFLKTIGSKYLCYEHPFYF